MDILMDREKLKALAKELAKDIKTEADLNMLSRCSGLICTDTSIGGKFTIRGKLDEKRSQKI
jgi:hypothetical protein